METIGLIAAMAQESNALSSHIKGWKRTTLGLFSGKCFELAGKSCILVTSGMGIRRASEATRELIEINAPRLLISFGIAGAIEADLEIGDVVAVEAVCRLDQGVAGPLQPLNYWPDAAREAIVQILAGRGAHVFTGTAITTGGSQVLENQLREMVHPILEMETAGIAQVAAEHGIPLLALRTISDGPRATIPFNLGEIMDDDANLQADKLLKTIIRNPRIVFQSRQLIRNSRIAADNAAIALIAALNELVI
jgi:nucleoside phosphorylase